MRNTAIFKGFVNLLISILAVAQESLTPEILRLDESNFDATVSSNRHMLVLFCAEDK